MHKDKVFDLDRVGDLMMGSGYTDMTLVHDGSGERCLGKVGLSNGDGLLVRYWSWYNK